MAKKTRDRKSCDLLSSMALPKLYHSSFRLCAASQSWKFAAGGLRVGVHTLGRAQKWAGVFDAGQTRNKKKKLLRGHTHTHEYHTLTSNSDDDDSDERHQPVDDENVKRRRCVSVACEVRARELCACVMCGVDILLAQAS